jgi:hypothetical protein
MESTLVKLKGDFNNIITIRSSVKNVFDILEVRIDKLRQIYTEFIKNNKNEMFVFGLDSFQFQSKLIDIEYDDMKRLFLVINNRMYCEYFKLHKIIVEYITKNINDKHSMELTKVNNFPIYKDLEPFKEYNFELILDIHENILNLLNVIISVINNKENELSIHKTKQHIGLNIDNFISTFTFNISVMREKIIMFINYIEFFHKMHSKYLKRFSNKIQLMYTHVTNDIKFDDSIEISKHKKKELVDEFVKNNIDTALLKELKTSIGSETNSEVSNHESNTYTFDNEMYPSPLSLSSSSQNIRVKSFGDKKGSKSFIASLHNISDKPINESKLSINEYKFSNTDVEQLFTNINQSCDLLINDTIGLSIDSNDENKEEDNDSVVLSYNNFEDNEEKIEYYDYNHTDNTVQITKSIDSVEDIKAKDIKDEDIKNEDIEPNLNPTENIAADIPVKVEKKKKRTNKKKQNKK